MIGDAMLSRLPPVRPAAADHGPGVAPVGGGGGEATRSDRGDVRGDAAVAADDGTADERGSFGADGRRPGLVGVTLYQDAASKRCVAVIRDKTTGEVIEQIPTDRVLEHYAALRERFEHIGVEIEV